MATSESAKKRIRIIERKTAVNKVRRSKLKTAIKRFEEAVEANDIELAKERLVLAKKMVDKSSSKGIIHKNNAARKKSKLDRKFNSLTA